MLGKRRETPRQDASSPGDRRARRVPTDGERKITSSTTNAAAPSAGAPRKPLPPAAVTPPQWRAADGSPDERAIMAAVKLPVQYAAAGHRRRVLGVPRPGRTTSRNDARIALGESSSSTSIRKPRIAIRTVVCANVRHDVSWQPHRSPRHVRGHRHCLGQRTRSATANALSSARSSGRRAATLRGSRPFRIIDPIEMACRNGRHAVVMRSAGTQTTWTREDVPGRVQPRVNPDIVAPSPWQFERTLRCLSPSTRRPDRFQAWRRQRDRRGRARAGSSFNGTRA